MAGKKGMTHYPNDMKLRAVQMYLEEGLPYAAITAALNIRDPKRVKIWVRAYRREGATAFTHPIGRPRKHQTVQSELERLRMENALLKKFHTELRKLELAKRNIG
jgi:transposase